MTIELQASGRLPLLARAERILAGEEDAPQQQRQDLADGIERWRYELLDEHHGALKPEDSELADALDLALNQLAGRSPRPPRWPRGPIAAASCRSAQVDRAVACLDRGVSLQELARRAAELTREHFATSPAGRQRMLLYAPLYLSSHCINHCVYCGFRQPQRRATA